ncbi:GntR family transcriptional regulator [Prauserella oleivorans]
MRLHRTGSLPLYRQVQQVLQERIESRALLPGDRLPTEHELARELAVNRLTVRQAISELARAGQLVVRQGIGTFVAEPPAHFVVTLGPERSMAAVEHTTRTLEQEGMPAREVFLSSAIEDCAEAREQLRLPGGACAASTRSFLSTANRGRPTRTG